MKLSEQGKHKVQFKIYAPQAKEVLLAGSFNKWNPARKRLKKNDRGEWVCRTILAEGKYTYKFVIDGVWTNDPGADAFEQNGLGDLNSVRNV